MKNKTKGILSPTAIGFILVLIAAISYGLLPSISQLAYEKGMIAETIIFWKFFLATIGIVIYVRRSKTTLIIRKDQLVFLLMIAIVYYLSAFCIYEAFKRMTGAIAVIIVFMFPIIIMFYEWIINKNKISSKKLISVGLTLIGLAMIGLGSTKITVSVTGVLFSIGTAACYAVYTIGIGALKIRQISTIVTVCYIVFFSTIIAFIKCTVSKAAILIISPMQWSYVLISAVFCVAIAVVCYAKGIELLGTVRASIVAACEPVSACIFGYFLMKDPFTWNMLIACLLLIMATKVNYCEDS